MASNIKDGSNYLDGVPVKISSKFLPPNPVTIPLALDTKFSTDLLSEQYDFSLERKVIEHNKRRLLEIEAAKTKPSPKPLDADATPSDSQLPKEAAKKATQCPWSSNTILQPCPQQPLGKTPSDAKSNDTKINLSDFENDTSSPFDYMELQTINDLEELNSVFQGINGKREQQEQQQELAKDTSSTEEMSAVAKSVSFPLPQNPWPDKMPNSLSENFTSGMRRLSQPTEDFASSLPNDPPGYLVKDHPQFDQFSAGHGSSTNGHSQFDRFVAMSSHPQYPSSMFAGSAGPCDTVGYSTLSQVPYITSNAGAPVVKKLGDKSVPLRGSKSYSDISSLSDVEIMNSAKERSRTPPSYCSVSNPVAQEPLSLHEDHFQAPLDKSSNGLCNNDSSAYEELDEASRRFVDSLTEMGFPQGQVSRAVKHLGTDEKKVVEHLCQIQALEESGYDSSEAEAALHLHDYNRDQAKEFLDLVNQFQDLGFEKDAVKKALVQNKNDWNKTIDALLP